MTDNKNRFFLASFYIIAICVSEDFEVRFEIIQGDTFFFIFAWYAIANWNVQQYFVFIGKSLEEGP